MNKTKRKSISKKTRFEIFKRDDFTCQYCGSHPPSVILHIDHIVPVKDGGDNQMDNLITSCSSCNLGKSANSLNSVPLSLKEKANQVKESELQLKEYTKILKAKKDRIEIEKWQIAASLEGVEYIRQYNAAKMKSIEIFLNKLHFYQVLDAAENAFHKFTYREYPRFKYFCGICWKIIKGEQNG